MLKATIENKRKRKRDRLEKSLSQKIADMLFSLELTEGRDYGIEHICTFLKEAQSELDKITSDEWRIAPSSFKTFAKNTRPSPTGWNRAKYNEPISNDNVYVHPIPSHSEKNKVCTVSELLEANILSPNRNESAESPIPKKTYYFKYYVKRYICDNIAHLYTSYQKLSS